MKRRWRSSTVILVLLSSLLAVFLLAACGEGEIIVEKEVIKEVEVPVEVVVEKEVIKEVEVPVEVVMEKEVPVEVEVVREVEVIREVEVVVTATPGPVVEPVFMDATSANITVDGDTFDWAGIPATTVNLTQLAPIPGVEWGEVGDIEVDLRFAVNDERVFVLMEVPGDFLYNPADHHLSPALAVMFRIEEPAAPHMGTTEEDQQSSLGKVDIWHWELDCGPGELSGGGTGIVGGNDPPCNLDDEWSTTPEAREDDGSVDAENSIAGVWEHTARAQGSGSDGTWIFEMSRKLQTGDPDDAQLVLGGHTAVALAWWAADETTEGWTAAGHLTNANQGWITLSLPHKAVPAPIQIAATTADISVDGNTLDWLGIPITRVNMTQLAPIPGVEWGEVADIPADLRVASDGERIYVLMEVPGSFLYNPDDHHFSPALAVMFRIDEPAAPHMGTTEEDQQTSLGKVDIWHWELDCGPGELSGGGDGIVGGNDPPCNLDDEWSTTPEQREDDGSVDAENSISGVWEHTARSQGAGANGTWIFEMSRKLQTGDPDDAQLAAGGTASVAIAWWAADETAEGWTAAGHLTNANSGWMAVSLPD